MDEQRFQQAEGAYATGDYKAAAREYLAAVHGSPPEGSGTAYHMAGNALMKLHRYSDAATVYGHAVKDGGYDKRGIVYANLGTALAAAGRPDDAVSAFDAALVDPFYSTAWKALQGKAGALYKANRFEEAATAYREASWADGNPDPGKALNNLGLCFMALERPEDAIEAYRAALAVEGYAGKGKAAANLGLALGVMGFARPAVAAFEDARDTYGHELTGASLTAYEALKRSVPPEPIGEQVEGWATGEMQPVFAEGEHGWGEQDIEADDSVTDADAEGEDQFFTRTEEEMVAVDREARKAERTVRREGRSPWLTFGVISLAVVVLVGLFLGLWYGGVGYPTQASAVSGMIDAYSKGGSVEAYWVAVPSTDIKQEMRHLPAEFSSYQITGVRRGPTSSVVRVSVKLSDQAAPLAYDILLVREGVGWKVDGIRNAWSSTNQGS